MRRGALAKIFFGRAHSGLRGIAGQVGAERGASLGGLQQSEAGEKANYYSAVCLETGEVEWMELEGNSNGESSLSWNGCRGGRLNVMGQCAAHRGPVMRTWRPLA